MGLLVGTGVIFANAKKSATSKVRDPVGIAHGRVRGDGFGRFAGALSIQSLIGEIGKIDNSFRDAIRPTSVFMDSRANVQRGRGQGVCGSVGVPLDNGVPPAFIGTAFDPEHPIPIESDLSEPDGF